MLSANTGRLSIPEDRDPEVIILESESGDRYILVSEFTRGSDGRIILRNDDIGVPNLELRDKYVRRLHNTVRDITYLDDEDIYVERYYSNIFHYWQDIPTNVALSTLIAVAPKSWEIKDKMKVDNVYIPPGIEEWIEDIWCRHDAGKVLEKKARQKNTESPTQQHRDIFRWFWEGGRFGRFGYWTIKQISDGTGINQSSVSARMTEERFDDLKRNTYNIKENPKRFSLRPATWFPKPNQDTIQSFK